MQTITLTQKDFEDNKIQYSSTGYIIDELSFAVSWYDYNDVSEMNYEYRPKEPYNFNYEKDLLENTKTPEQYYTIINELYKDPTNIDRYRNDEIYGTPLQTGAFIALNYPDTWNEILDEYTDQIKSAETDSISPAFNAQLEKELSDYEDDMYSEFLYGDQSSNGITYEIQKKFSEKYIRIPYDKDNHSFDFIIDPEAIKEEWYHHTQGKKYLLDWIQRESSYQAEKRAEQARKRKEEYDRVKNYKAERKAKEEQEHKEYLLSLTK